MDPSTAQHQEMPNNPSSLENMLVCSTKPQQQQDRKPRPQPEQALKCPRCDSTNTKFCYYNNYSLSQPRYFCKSCRRYWTKGGTLRNVPVGGGCRKNKRSSSSSSKNKSQDQSLVVPSSGHPLAASLPHLSYDTNDLSLAFARLQKQSVGFDQDHHEFAMLGSDVLGNPSITSTAGAAPAAFLDALRSNFLGTQNGNFVHHGFHNYGFGSNGSLGEVEHGIGIGIGIGIGVGVGDHQQQEQIGLPAFEDQLTSTVASTAAVSVTTMKQEISENRDSRVLWGFPWQLSHGDHNHHGPSMSDLDTARESWNNSTNFTSAWHGLLNSPLM